MTRLSSTAQHHTGTAECISDRRAFQHRTGVLCVYMEEEVPVIDISKWIIPSNGRKVEEESDDAAADDCRRMADALHRFGIVLVKDPRVSEVDNNAFLDQMEIYYMQSDGVKDARPEVHYTCTQQMQLLL